jgi:hypothetical protein
MGKLNIMTPNDAINIIDLIFNDSHFNDTQEKVFRRIWEGKTYESIAEELDYETSYVKHVGACLLRSLSQVTGHKITKSNCHSAFRKIKNNLDLEQSKSSKYQSEFAHNRSSSKKIQRIKSLFEDEIFNSSSFSEENFEPDISAKILNDVQFQLKNLILDLVDHPPLFEDFLQKVTELKVKIKSKRY